MKKRTGWLLNAVLGFSVIFSSSAALVPIRSFAAEETSETAGADTAKEDLAGLKYDHSLELQYADQFAVDYYEGDYALITIEGGDQFLLVPEGKEAPEGLDEDITVIHQPLENIYLVATSTMDFFRALDGIGSISLSGTKADGWYIDEAKEALESGAVSFAGKYNAPDYELILSKKCDLALESTMIYHNPEVKEKLEEFGIPVLVEHSSYENHPLGRTEWVKLYGVLLDKEEEAEAVFEEQAEKLNSIKDSENTGKTVAFFYINSMGSANVRKSNDYVSKMIELAGGRYIFDSLGDEDDATSTMSMQMEEFYAGAKDADYIIYNSTIEGELSSVDDLLAKSPLFEKFKAVQEGHVYCTSKNLYQSTMSLGTITSDIRRMLTGDDADLTYIYKLE